MSKRHLNIYISGRVQGVWYRASARKKALELGLKGRVSNLPDGRVYAEAEGTRAQLNAFVEWCQQGPELARVDGVEVAEGELKNYNDFEIVR